MGQHGCSIARLRSCCCVQRRANLVEALADSGEKRGAEVLKGLGAHGLLEFLRQRITDLDPNTRDTCVSEAASACCLSRAGALD